MTIADTEHDLVVTPPSAADAGHVTTVAVEAEDSTRWFWHCSCGIDAPLNYGDEADAREAADLHELGAPDFDAIRYFESPEHASARQSNRRGRIGPIEL